MNVHCETQIGGLSLRSLAGHARELAVWRTRRAMGLYVRGERPTLDRELARRPAILAFRLSIHAPWIRLGHLYRLLRFAVRHRQIPQVRRMQNDPAFAMRHYDSYVAAAKARTFR